MTHTGILYMDKCAYEDMIPIYLIVGGSTALLYILLLTIQQIYESCKKKRKKAEAAANPSDIEEAPAASDVLTEETPAGETRETSEPANPDSLSAELKKIDEEEATLCDMCSGCYAMFIISWFIAGVFKFFV